MEDLQAEMAESHSDPVNANGARRVTRRENEEDAEERSPRVVDHHLTSTGKRIQRKKYQHPGELPRTNPNNPFRQNAARRQEESSIEPDERLQQQRIQHHQQQVLRETSNMPGGFTDGDPEDFYRSAARQQQLQNRQSQRGQNQNQPQQSSREREREGRDSAESRQTSTQSRADNSNSKGHRKKLSQAELELVERLSTPKRITPKKTWSQKNTGRQLTDREIARQQIYHGGAARSRAVELPFNANDHWSNSKVQRMQRDRERDEMMQIQMQMQMQGHRGRGQGQPEQFIERQEQQQGTFGFAQLLGWVAPEPQPRRPTKWEMEMENLHKRWWHSQKNNEELKNDIAELSKANDALQADLRKIQQKSFSAMSKSAWTPLEDRTISDILQEIHQDLEAWADENCLESFGEVRERLNEAQQVELLELCGKVADVTQPDLASQFKWWDERHLDPILLLTALMTYRMYTCVFDNEFLALGIIDQGSMNMMHNVYVELAKLDFKQAQVWRGQLMRIIVGTPQSGGRFDGINSSLDVSSFVKRYCDDILDDLETFCEHAFLKTKLSSESRGSLLGCWTRAAELFVQLQTQVAALQWKATTILRNTVNQRYVESHRSQAFPKGRNDGKPISLVLSPMVTFNGNEDGDRYEDWRAVCKATVLVIDEEIEESEEEEGEETGEEGDESMESGSEGEERRHQREGYEDDGSEIL